MRRCCFVPLSVSGSSASWAQLALAVRDEKRPRFACLTNRGAKKHRQNRQRTWRGDRDNAGKVRANRRVTIGTASQFERTP